MQAGYQNVRVIGLDADDTLWATSPLYAHAFHTVATMLAGQEAAAQLQTKLHEMHSRNAPIYGYGALGMLLTLTEAAAEIIEGTSEEIKAVFAAIVQEAKNINNAEIVLYPGTKEAITELREQGYQIVIVTKGATAEQTAKITRSGLGGMVDGSIILPHKSEQSWQSVIASLGLADNPSDFLSVGDSLNSDILPVLACGGRAVWVDHHHHWEDGNSVLPDDVDKIDSLADLPALLTTDNITTENEETLDTKQAATYDNARNMLQNTDNIAPKDMVARTDMDETHEHEAPHTPTPTPAAEDTNTTSAGSVLKPAFTNKQAVNKYAATDGPVLAGRWLKLADGGYAVRFTEEEASDLDVGTICQVSIERRYVDKEDGEHKVMLLPARPVKVTGTDPESGQRMGQVLNAQGEAEPVYPKQ